MNQKQLTQVRGILKEVSAKYDNINWGGCGAFAAMLAKHIARMTDSALIVSCGGYCNIDEARKSVNDNIMIEWENKGAEFHHVWVEFKCNNRWYAADSDGIRRRNDMRNRQPAVNAGSFTIKEMQELGDQRAWNPSFDRDQLFSMKNIVGRRFNSIIA